MKPPGRNDPCPCGSGKKFKRCCLSKHQSSATFTREDRARVIAALRALIDEDRGTEHDESYEILLGENYDRWLDASDEWSDMDDAFHDAWFWYDWPQADGRTPVERVLAEATGLRSGERRFLELGRASCVRPYEVIDVRPGLSVTLRELLSGAQVTVRERTASRALSRSDLIAARVFSMGASGEPEFDMGLLPLPRLIRDSLVAHLTSALQEFRGAHPGATETAFWKWAAPLLHGAWVSCILDPPLPRLANTDGEPMILARVRHDVRDTARVSAALDAAPELERDGDHPRWTWPGDNAAGKLVVLGTLSLEGA